MDVQQFALFRRYLRQKCGIVLDENKAYLVRSRLTPLVHLFEFDSLSALLNAVHENAPPALQQAVINAMTTNETLWFRDSHPFAILRQHLLPEVSALNRPVRIWSAACSSGQEPYSIAICIREYQKQHPNAFVGGVEILATDISTEVLRKAENGDYDHLALSRGLSPHYLQDFFVPGAAPDSRRVTAEIRKLVRFQQFNLQNSFAGLGKFDIVFCRNVLIYFDDQMKMRILQQIAAALQNPGFLLLGASESANGLGDVFTLSRSPNGLYYQRK